MVSNRLYQAQENYSLILKIKSQLT